MRRTPINNTFKFKRTHSNTNVRAVRQGPTRHPFHPCIQQTKINAEWPLQLWVVQPAYGEGELITLPNANNINVRPVRLGPSITIPVPFHIFNNRRSTQRRHYCILFVQHIKVRLRPPNTNDTVKFEHARSNTNVHTVRAVPARQRFIHYSGQHMMRAGLWPHTTSNTDNTLKFEHARSSNRNVRAVRLEPPWHQAVP